MKEAYDKVGPNQSKLPWRKEKEGALVQKAFCLNEALY